MKKTGNLIILVAMLAGALATTACNGITGIIDHVTFAPSANLGALKASLVFSNTIQSTLSGAFAVGNYGTLFVNPYTPSTPFEVGFDLDTSIVNDQTFLHLQPTEVLPNGQPIGIGYPLVQIKAEQPINSKFDLYGYVDVSQAAWLGADAVLTFLDPTSFPSGLSLSQVFLRDSKGNAQVFGSVYGPTLNADGTINQPGGIAIFANIAGLLVITANSNADQPSQTALTLQAEPMVHLGGPTGPEFRDVATLMRVQKGLTDALNSTK